MEILQIVAVGITGTILSVALKKENPQFSILLGLATGIIIFLFLADYLARVFAVLSELTDSAGINSRYMNVVFKVVGISYISRFASELSKDAGENAIATKIDLAGKILIALAATPVMMALMEMVQNFM